MKQRYEEPELELVVLETSDVITTSNDPDGPVIED